MAVYYTCDRCGTPCPSYVKRFHRVDLSNWKGDGTLEPRTEPLDIRVEVTQHHTDGDRPELCDACLATAYEAIAKSLRPQPVEPAPSAAESAETVGIL